PPWVDLLEADRPRSRYGPSWIDRFESTDAFQLARFPRGDSSIVVGGIEPGDALDGATRYDVALAAGPGPGGAVVERRDSTASLAGLRVALQGDPIVASIELA